MEKPRISWQILEEVYTDEWEYIQYKNYTEESSYIPGESVEKTIQVWKVAPRTVVVEKIDFLLIKYGLV